MQDEKIAYKKYLNDREGADQYNAFKGIIYGKPDSLVLKIFKNIFPLVKGKKSIGILDIGGGDGKRIRQLIDLFSAKNIMVSATLVEPSKAFTNDCQEAISGTPYKIKVVKSIFEKYKKKDKFDLILMIHSFYTFKDDKIFKEISRLMAKGGYLFIVGNAEDSPLAKLKMITRRSRKGSRADVNFIFAGLQKYKFKYEVKNHRTIFDGCIKNNELTEEGKLIVSWIALMDYSKIPRGMKKEILEVFRGENKNTGITEKEVFIIARK